MENLDESEVLQIGDDDTLKQAADQFQDIMATVVEKSAKKGRHQEARRQMNASPKNRGFKFSAGGNLPLDKNLTAKLALLKAHSPCHDCGALGHWKGDPQCPKRGQRKAGGDASSSSGSSFAKPKFQQNKSK